MFFDVYLSLCESRQKTANGVAKELGFASSSVTQWKHGSTPRPSALQRIADYFEVSVHYLLGAEQKEKSPAPEGAELDEETIQLKEIWDSADQEERDALLAMAKMLKARRNK